MVKINKLRPCPGACYAPIKPLVESVEVGMVVVRGRSESAGLPSENFT